MPITILPEWFELTNAEIAAKLDCTPTAVMYARRRAAGVCERREGVRLMGHNLCLKHAVEVARTRRRRSGSKAWTRGGRGRPPKGSAQ